MVMGVRKGHQVKSNDFFHKFCVLTRRQKKIRVNRIICDRCEKSYELILYFFPHIRNHENMLMNQSVKAMHNDAQMFKTSLINFGYR